MEISNNHKVLIGFKCSPDLRLILCNQANSLGVTLSSHVETIVSNQDNAQNEIKGLTEQVRTLKNRIVFYENPFLLQLFEENKGKVVSYKDKSGAMVNHTINSIQDVFTIIINSFKTTK